MGTGPPGTATSWWLARGEQHLPDDLSWLSHAEAAYAEKARFTKRRTEFLVARWAGKCALAEVLSVAPTSTALRRLEVRHAASGAPLAYLDGRPTDVQISMTDRAGWAVCLLSTGSGRVGCDLELVETRSAAFVNDYLTESEQRYVSGADADLAANLIWSAKESGLKVLTTGLRRDTRSVEVTVLASDDEWQQLSVRTQEGDDFPGWWQRFGAFVVTLAAQHPMPMPVSLDDPPLLSGAVPTHSWLDEPTQFSPFGPSRAQGHR
jgi:4'-phosphopantetheinyl transferase